MECDGEMDVNDFRKTAFYKRFRMLSGWKDFCGTFGVGLAVTGIYLFSMSRWFAGAVMLVLSVFLVFVGVWCDSQIFSGLFEEYKECGER